MDNSSSSRAWLGPDPGFGAPPDDAGEGEAQPETTGRTIVIFKDRVANQESSVPAMLNDIAGLRHVAASRDFAEGTVLADEASGADAVHFSRLGVAVVSDPGAVEALAASVADTDSPIMVIEPEYVAYLLDPPGSCLSLDYLRGFSEAASHLYAQASQGGGPAQVQAELLAALQDTDDFTWGLQAVGAHTSGFTGHGVRVAVLDTGIDLQHPDFHGRGITAQSFVRGVTVADVHGHGTHCAGTACGPQRPASGMRRYGVAHGAQLFVGKVFNNAPRPSAVTGDVIAGIDWAVGQGCRVASLSLGVPTRQQIDQYAVPTRRALNQGTLVVAAAGNNAERPGNPGFVEAPANANAVVAVAALDGQMRIAPFSGRSTSALGAAGRVNIAGPGVAVFSSTIRGGHRALDGTSMATPHVAGIAALWAEARGEAGPALWSRLVQTARALPLESADVGAGLVQAPQ
jgi:subtilisin